MLISEKYKRDDGVELIRHYSDAGLMIRKEDTGEVYEDAVDLTPCLYTYEETDTRIGSELEI